MQQQSLSTTALKEYEQIYLCPISMQLMENPVDLPCSHTFDKQNIVPVLLKFQKCPLCRHPTTKSQIKINRMAKQGIQIFKKQIQRKKQKQKQNQKQRQRQRQKQRQKEKPKFQSSFQIFIKHPYQNKTLTLEVTGNETLECLRQKLGKKYNSFASCSCLQLRNWRNIGNQGTLNDYGIVKECTINSYYTSSNSNCKHYQKWKFGGLK